MTAAATDAAREALFPRVLEAIRALDGRPDPATRDALLLEVLRFQARAVPPFGRLLAARGVEPERVRHPDDFPALPTDVFRHARVAAHEPARDTRVFRTSGTTSGERGAHPLRTLALYDEAARRAARRWLFPDAAPTLRLVMLAPSDAGAPDSSLSHMLARFGGWFGDGRPTWTLAGDALDAETLAAAVRDAERAGAPVALLGTSFAFVHAEDALGDARFRAPEGSLAMVTGGYKGRSRTLDPADLRARVARRFGVPAARVVAEYGMTELSSQAYETTLAGAPGPRRLVPPPWVRVVPVDPERLRPVAPGEVGVLRIDDLANLDGAAAIQTSDLGRRVGDQGFEVLGRAPGSVPRGCALAVDDALGGPR